MVLKKLSKIIMPGLDLNICNNKCLCQAFLFFKEKKLCINTITWYWYQYRCIGRYYFHISIPCGSDKVMTAGARHFLPVLWWATAVAAAISTVLSLGRLWNQRDGRLTRKKRESDCFYRGVSHRPVTVCCSTCSLGRGPAGGGRRGGGGGGGERGATCCWGSHRRTRWGG